MNDCFLVVDDCGVRWDFNGHRVYTVEAEKEFIEMGLDVNQNGYPANSKDEALALLVKYGYMEEK